jgi:hypothetical protein
LLETTSMSRYSDDGIIASVGTSVRVQCHLSHSERAIGDHSRRETVFTGGDGEQSSSSEAAQAGVGDNRCRITFRESWKATATLNP